MGAPLSSVSFYYQHHIFFFTAVASLLLISTTTLVFTLVLSNRNAIGTGKGKSSKRRPRLNLPPGPPAWPVVGNLLQLSRSGKPFFQYVRDLVAEYGPIFTLKMGAQTMIIISSPELAHEALIDKGLIFASRPPRDTPTRAIFSNNKFTVNSAVYGSVWRSLRRNMVQNALSPTRVKGFRSVREAAMDKLINRLATEAEANGGAVWVLRNARFAVFCILMSMCFGLEEEEELTQETIDRTDQMMKAVLVTLEPRLDDYLPIFAPFFFKQRKRAMQVRRQQIQTLTPFIQDRRRRFRTKTPDAYSYIDTLFALEMEGRKAELTDADIVTLCSEFLNGGTDTTATAIEWAVARLIENPEIQSKLRHEVSCAVGGAGGPPRAVEERDVETMPYLNAVVKELLRKHPPTYFALTHAATEAATVGGYDVPAGASVEFFLPAISEDPMIWSEPKSFVPERFMGGGGKEEVDITGVKGVKMMPFGAGRRICPGLTMATLHINLMLARMVQEFEWSAAGGTAVDFSEKFEFTVVMNNTLRAAIKPAHTASIDHSLPPHPTPPRTVGGRD